MTTNIHLVILVHGLWGNPTHLSYLEKQITQNIIPSQGKDNDNDNEIIQVYKTGSHSGYMTYDGIDINGKRISDEILTETKRLENNPDHKIIKFSIIGYSLGGLIARYSIGILYSHGYFNSIKPINFVTFCTPHVGVRNPMTPTRSIRIYNKLAPLTLAITGRQLFLTDKVGKFNKPLLVWMADPKSLFYKVLNQFKYKSLYSNVVNDKRTSWYTSAICAYDPVNSVLNSNPINIKATYVKGYEPTVIDINQPVSYEEQGHHAIHDSSLWRYMWMIFSFLALLFKTIIHTPIWAIAVIISSTLQTIRLNKRVREFLSDTSNNLLHLYEYVEQELTDFENHEYRNETTTTAAANKTESIMNDIENEVSDKLSDTQDSFVEHVYETLGWEEPHSKTASPLYLNEDQQYIIKSLNSLEWNKYPAILRHTLRTHSDIIVRNEFDQDVNEGKVVINHFVNEVFKTQ
ncbi:uncharacterized protein J8A68_000518 [[Candida] subhashii]|uniref:DUF676 domain-containing protein n=1 Tax=[Candida] subhashii TaxID=561895 RepID=A0A8J5QVJ6_9ASCO|nr:uncharacterized protein J8A68_000518 [[Candida] subhashii]KAG7665895.1 hypothetical protein J8A68_000518 [[Candida] subhashii]